MLLHECQSLLFHYRLYKCLRSMGFKFRKAGSLPGKADPEKQEEFKKKLWNLY